MTTSPRSIAPAASNPSSPRPSAGVQRNSFQGSFMSEPQSNQPVFSIEKVYV